MSDAVPDRRTPRWGLAVGLLVVVSAAIFGLGKLVPFEPSADVAAAEGGDATRGAGLFATNCAECHGQDGTGGGIGPALAGVPRQTDAIASVIATGRGAMPAGLVSGADAADVVAYVSSIGGGGGETPTAGRRAGTVSFTGERRRTVVVRLDEPAPQDWSVWVVGSAGPRLLSTIGAGERRSQIEEPAQGGLDTSATSVLVGPSAERPALRAEITGLGPLLVSSPAAPRGQSLIDAAAGQVEVLQAHIRFLRLALDERNLPNIRFHGEHMVNIVRGAPAADVDGNGDPSNPGDGVGLLGRPGDAGYLPRIVSLAGADLGDADRLDSGIRAIAEEGERCGTAASIASGRPCVDGIAARAPEVAQAWEAVTTAVRAKATVPLVEVP